MRRQKEILRLLNSIAKKELKRPRAKFGRCYKCKKELGEFERQAWDLKKKYCIPCAKKSKAFAWVKDWKEGKR